MGYPRIVIVGGGPAGVRAAESLVAHGLRPVLVDESPYSGGQIYRRQPEGFRRSYKTLYGFEAQRAARLHQVFDTLADKIDCRPGTLVWSVEPGKLHLKAGQASWPDELEYDYLILATGAMDRVLPLPGWTLPGVFTLGGAQVCLKYQACAIGERVVFMGTGPLLYLVAYQYAQAGGRVEAVLDTSSRATSRHAVRAAAAWPAPLLKGVFYMASLRRQGIPVLRGVTLERIEGAVHVNAVVCTDSSGRQRSFECDAVGLGFGLQSETQLADLAGCEFAWDDCFSQWLPITDSNGRSSVDNVYLCGDGARVRGADFAEAGGELAALAVLEQLKLPVPATRQSRLRRSLTKGKRFADAIQRLFPVPLNTAARLADDTVLCRCEGVTAGELRRAACDLDAQEVNRAKALVRVGMGRCQGRVCGTAVLAVLADARNLTPATVGRIRGQGPVKPLLIQERE